MLGVASAEAPTVTPTRTVSVAGVAEVPLAQGANAATATAAYRQAMAAAVADGQSKAEFLAGKVGATLGPVQSVGEDGGSISCSGLNEEGNYVQYEGEQPDFGTARGPAVLAEGTAAPPKAPSATLKHARKKKKKKAKTALAAASCTLSAQVSLVYAIG
jgi:uncharacterized protein YggE